MSPRYQRLESRLGNVGYGADDKIFTRPRYFVCTPASLLISWSPLTQLITNGPCKGQLQVDVTQGFIHCKQCETLRVAGMTDGETVRLSAVCAFSLFAARKHYPLFAFFRVFARELIFIALCIYSVNILYTVSVSRVVSVLQKIVAQ